MSTLKVNAIRGTGASSDAISVNATDGTCTAKITNNLSNRNLIINGAMRINQRNSASTTSDSATYYLDRWSTQSAALDQASIGVSQVTDAPDGFSHSMKFTVNTPETAIAADEYASIYQKMEGQDLQQLKYGISGATDVTMSFWVKSSITGTFSYTVYRSESAQNRIVNKTYTINSADTWERKTITIAGDTSNAITDDTSARWWNVWHLGAGSDWTSVTSSTWANYSNTNWAGGQATNAVLTTNGATWAITGVQLEVGDVATEFEHRSFGDELARCQRYYQKSYEYGTAVGTATSTGAVMHSLSGSQTYASPGSVKFPVQMRTTPTMTIYGTTGTAGKITADSTDANGTAFGHSETGSMFTRSNDTAGTGANVFIRCHYTAVAEL